MHSAVAVFQTLAVLSAEAVSNNKPSGENTPESKPKCTKNTVTSQDAVLNMLPVGLEPTTYGS